MRKTIFAVCACVLLVASTAEALKVDDAKIDNASLIVHGRQAKNNAPIALDGTIWGYVNSNGTFRIYATHLPDDCIVRVFDGFDSQDAIVLNCAPRGFQGLQGPKGDTGAPGLKGDIGLTGLRGLQGPAGQNGNKGDQGIQGLKGDMGLTGLRGLQGLNGAIGSQGLPGAKGDTGNHGLQGIQGIAGIQGLKGDAGTAGDIGETGEQGLQGEKGDTGERGPIGLTGAQCLKGDKGDTGNQGLQGPKGDTGEQGPQGITGRELHLFDANGKDLGIFVGVDDGFFVIVTPSLNYQLRFISDEPPQTSTAVTLFFNGPNCSQLPYPEDPPPWIVATSYDPTKLWQNNGVFYRHWTIQIYTPARRTYRSYLNNGGSCVSESASVDSTIPVEIVDIPVGPFSIGVSP